MSKKSKAHQKANNLTIVETASHTIKTTAPNTGFKNRTNWLVVLSAILPFLFSEKLIDPVVAIRYLFLGIFIFLFIIVFFFIGKKNAPANLPLPVKIIFLLGIVFVGWSIVSSANAINPNEGFYIISRHLLNLLLLFIIMYSVINEEKQLIKVAKTLVIAGILQSFIGISQFYGTAFTELPGNFIPYGLMANRNLFGSALMLLIPFCLLVLHQSHKTWKYLAAISLLLLIVSIFLSQTRSAWVAAILIFITSLILISIFSPTNRSKWIKASAIGFVISAIIISLLFFGNQNEEFTKSIKERAASLTTGSADSSGEKQNVQERFKIWNKTIGVIKKSPLTGVGPGNWRIAVPAMGTSGLVWEKGKYVPDQPHNDFLLTASETGIPGALFYFIPFIFITLLGFKIVLKSTSDEKKIITILMLSGMAGFAVDSMFSFPQERIEHSLYFTLLCGIILGLYYNFSVTEKTTASSFPKWATAAAIAIAAFNIFIGVKKYNFEIHLNRAMAYDKAGQNDLVLAEVKAGKNSFVTLDPVAKSIEIYSSNAYQKQENFDMALKEAGIATKYNPNSYMVYNNIGTIFTDKKNYEMAIKYYLKALALTPKFEMSLFNLAVNYFELKKYKECIETLNKVNWQSDNYLTSIYNEASSQLKLQQQTPVIK